MVASSPRSAAILGPWSHDRVVPKGIRTHMLVAQITDTHIRAGGEPACGGRVDTARFLRRAVERINAFSPAIDAVILSGDLADDGSAAAYAAAADILGSLRPPLFAVPGNHDERDLFRAVFGGGFLDPALPFCAGVAEGFPLRLIGLDSSLPGLPQGEIGDWQIDWLASALARGSARPTLIFVHHPPFASGISRMDAMGLRDGDRLIALLARHPQIRHLACGHLHRAMETSLYGLPVSVGPSPAHAVVLELGPSQTLDFSLEPPMLRLFRFNPADDGLVSHLIFVDSAPGPFPF